jgi:hypothetical protein
MRWFEEAEGCGGVCTGSNDVHTAHVLIERVLGGHLLRSRGQGAWKADLDSAAEPVGMGRTGPLCCGYQELQVSRSV